MKVMESHPPHYMSVKIVNSVNDSCYYRKKRLLWPEKQ